MKGGKNDVHMLTVPRRSRNIFWAKVEKTDTCWFYRGQLTEHGYGAFWYRRKVTTAHRAAKLWRSGKPHLDHQACHRCGNRNCVRPTHIYWGTHAENLADIIAAEKHRRDHTRGELHFAVTVTEKQVRAIWADLLKTPNALTPIAKRHRTSNSMVHVIKIKKSWAWLTDTLPALPEPIKAKNYPAISRKRRQPMSKEQIVQICKMLDDGVTLNDLSQHTTSCPATLKNIYYRERGVFPTVRGAAPRKRLKGRPAHPSWVNFLN